MYSESHNVFIFIPPFHLISSHVRSAQIENKFAPYSTEMSPYNMNIYVYPYYM